MKKYVLMILLFLISIIPFSSYSLVSRSDDIFVTDDAKLLSPSTKESILWYSKFLKEERDIDYYVVTLSNLENLSLEEYSETIFNSFQMNERGFLIVICKSSRAIYIKTGDELSSIFSNDMVDSYLKEYFVPYFKVSEWDKGIYTGYSAFLKKICEAYDIDASMIQIDSIDASVKYQSIILAVVVWVCTIFGYVYGKYINRVFLKQERLIGFHVVFGFFCFINLLLLYYCFVLKPIAIILVLGFEGITLFYTLDKSLFHKNNRKNRRKKF